MSKILNYDQFMHMIDNEKIYKLFPKNLKSHDIQYEENKTFTVSNFDNKECQNGIHITLFPYIFEWTCNCNYYYICEIIPDKNAKYVLYGNKIKTDIINVTNVSKISDFIISNIYDNEIRRFDVSRLLLLWSGVNNHVDVIEVIHKKYIKSKDSSSIFYGYGLNTVCEQVSICGHVDVIKYLHEKLKVTREHLTQTLTLSNACSSGHLNIVEYLHKSVGFVKKDFEINSSSICEKVCYYGHVHIIEYLHKEVGLTKQHFRQKNNYDYGHHVNVIKYLHNELKFTKEDLMSDNHYLCMNVCSNGHIDSVKYLHKDVGLTKEDFEINNNSIYVNTYKFKYFDVTKYLLNEVKINISLYQRFQLFLYWLFS